MTLSVTLSATGVGSVTLKCETAVYPYVGREIERDIVMHIFRDGGSASPEDAATVIPEPRPWTPVGEPLSLGIPFATSDVSDFVLGLGESDAAQVTMVDGYGSRAFVVSKVASRPRTDVPGRYDCSIDMVRRS